MANAVMTTPGPESMPVSIPASSLVAIICPLMEAKPVEGANAVVVTNFRGLYFHSVAETGEKALELIQQASVKKRGALKMGQKPQEWLVVGCRSGKHFLPKKSVPSYQGVVINDEKRLLLHWIKPDGEAMNVHADYTPENIQALDADINGD